MLSARKQGTIAEYRIADVSRDGARSTVRFFLPGEFLRGNQRGRWACGWCSGRASGYICASARPCRLVCVRVFGSVAPLLGLTVDPARRKVDPYALPSASGLLDLLSVSSSWSRPRVFDLARLPRVESGR
jgi:hypothetical protein